MAVLELILPWRIGRRGLMIGWPSMRICATNRGSTCSVCVSFTLGRGVLSAGCLLYPYYHRCEDSWKPQRRGFNMWCADPSQSQRGSTQQGVLILKNPKYIHDCMSFINPSIYNRINLHICKTLQNQHKLDEKIKYWKSSAPAVQPL